MEPNVLIYPRMITEAWVPPDQLAEYREHFMKKRTGEQGISSYELFIGALSVLSIIKPRIGAVPISGQVKQLILVVDVALTVIFLVDFTVRFISAPVKIALLLQRRRLARPHR